MSQSQVVVQAVTAAVAAAAESPYGALLCSRFHCGSCSQPRGRRTLTKRSKCQIMTTIDEEKPPQGKMTCIIPYMLSSLE